MHFNPLTEFPLHHTGEYVVGLYFGLTAGFLKIMGESRLSLVTPPYLPSATLYPTPVSQNAPVADLAELAADFQKADDGSVHLFGQRTKVSHPLTSFGLASLKLKPKV